MKQLAIFASGSGTNAENIVRLFHQGSRVRVAVALCNRKECGVYARLEALGVPVIYMPNSAWAADPERIIETLRPYNIDMIILAGFLRPVSQEIIDSVSGHVLNIHPSLLPSHGGKGMYGMKVHESVIAAGDAESGVTVHYVTTDIDAGEIIMQQSVKVEPDDTPESLAEKIHKIEYELFPRAIVKALARLEDHPSSPAVPQPPVPETSTASAAPTPESKSAVSISDAPPRSADEQWAEALHINNYSDTRAREAQMRAGSNSTSTPPPVASAPGVQLSAMHPAIAQARAEGKEIPKSYLWLSIVMAILFSTIPGIIAIVFSASVSSRLSCGDLKGAARASRTAQIWIIIAFVLGVLSATVWLPISMIAGL